MWRLRQSRDVDVWANATTSLSRRAASAVGLPTENHLVTREHGDVETFTYGFAVKRLWQAAGMKSKFGPRLSAVLLVLFSGAWPHVKLLLLNLNWLLPRGETSRTSSLYWLATLGKWSLADVLVVCVMIAVVHLDWDVDPRAIKEGAMRELPLFVDLTKGLYSPEQICAKALNYDCVSHPKGIKCWACETFVGEMYGHPDWAHGAGRQIIEGFRVSGGGQASLRIVGMGGIYVFCAAATLSLLIGVAIDLLDHRARAETARGRRVESESQAAGDASREVTHGRGIVNGGRDEEDPMAEALARHGSHTLPWQKRAWLVQRVHEGCCSSVCGYVTLVIVSLITALLVLLAAVLPTMERQVHGAGPYLLHEVLGIEWERTFSLYSLMEVTGEAGGPDYLLMGTFALFIIAGPLLRAVLCAINLLFPLSKKAHGTLLYWINFLGAFCAWDVFFVAVFMINLEIPPITNTIVMRPECKQVSDDGSCLEVEFNLIGAFGTVLAGAALTLLIATISVKMGFRGLDPYHDGDLGGPYWCGFCPCSSAKGGSDARARSCCCLGGDRQHYVQGRNRSRRRAPIEGLRRRFLRRMLLRRRGGAMEAGDGHTYQVYVPSTPPQQWWERGNGEDPFAYHPMGADGTADMTGTSIRDDVQDL